MSGITIERVHGQDVLPYLDALASLRIKVFREFPYLYEGSRDYETSYLRNYAKSPRSTVVLIAQPPRVAKRADAMTSLRPRVEPGAEGLRL